ncbi:hypothetical protein RclHR1_01950002 [Rhizophagus clarus]|uniref:Uncharacterized protein n=1 Tax=Rhizophagus clarus TaxID=94130 RepID=A0A2Z6QPJ4_9GLOM|nr:hypothetical protein RclHR1_01950002 [Rhizophagus clarus]
MLALFNVFITNGPITSDREAKLKQQASGANTPTRAKSPSLTSSSKTDQSNKHVRKDPECESFSSEEEQLENMMNTQQTLIQCFDAVAGGLQGVIEEAIHNLIGGFTNSQQINDDNDDQVLFDNDEEHLVTNNKDDADIENNVEI